VFGRDLQIGCLVSLSGSCVLDSMTSHLRRYILEGNKVPQLHYTSSGSFASDSTELNIVMLVNYCVCDKDDRRHDAWGV
jgi:hypothetical protein